MVKEENKENSPPKSLVSERPTEPPRLLRSCSLRGWIENGQLVYMTFCVSINIKCACV